MDFSKRSYEKELLDRTDIPFEDIKQNMRELDFINRHLGGHKITIDGFKSFSGNIGNQNRLKISICEIGCGGGDNLRVAEKYFNRHKIPVDLLGVDINPHCIEFAKSKRSNKNIRFFASDYKLMQFKRKPDIIFCSLFTHHFADTEVMEILKWMKENSVIGFFVNDLHRHPFAYYSIKWLTKLFSKNYLVKNDAPLSVLRGFKRKELEIFSHHSSIDNVSLEWKWAFRWLLIYTNAGTKII